VTLPFDTTQPEARSNPVTFYTDEETYRWLQDLVRDLELDRSLVVHRIVKAAREQTFAPEGERRAGDDRRKLTA
jgi:hypothetical protein